MAQVQLLTPPQVADRLQIHERTVTRWLRNGYLPGFKLGKEWRIAPSDLQAFMECNANQARPQEAIANNNPRALRP